MTLRYDEDETDSISLMIAFDTEFHTHNWERTAPYLLECQGCGAFRFLSKEEAAYLNEGGSADDL